MAQVTSDFISALFTNFQVLWQDAFLAADTRIDYGRFSLEVPSTTDTESYNWLGTVPKMQEWISERQYGAMVPQTYSLKNKNYEASVEIDRNEIEDDRFSMTRTRVMQLGAEAARFPAELMTTAIINGDSNACYDGANMFSTTHSEEQSGTQSNLLTGTGGDTLAHVRADYIAMRNAMMLFKDGRARVMNIAPDLVMIPVGLKDLFQQLINTTIIALSSGTQQSNVLQGECDIMVNPYLTDTNDWYGFCTKEVMKGFILQMRKPPEFVAVTNVADFVVFDRRKFYYGIDGRFAAGYGMWPMCIKTTNT